MPRPLLLLLLAGCAKPAESPHPADVPPPAKVGVGSAAPPPQFREWLLGDPLPGLTPGQPLVLDFWASWCGPCIQAAPHLQQVAAEFAGRVPVVGVTVPDDRNPVAAVVRVLGMTKANRYAVRHATIPRETLAAYGFPPYPTAVVIAGDGTIAYMGSPLLVEDVLDRLLAGTWNGKVSAAEVEGRAAELGAAFASPDPLPKLAAFEARHPDAVKRPPYRVSKVTLLVTAGKFDEAKPLTEELLPKLAERKDVAHLGNLRSAWADPKANPKRVHASLAVRAAEAVLAVEGPDDPGALAALADAHLFAGDKAKGRELLDRATAAAPDGSPARKWLAEQRKRYD